MRVLMIRHGQTPSNVQGLLDAGCPGPGLTRLGERQAAAIPGVVARREFGAIAVSTLTRTSLTARPLSRERGLEPVVLEGLREIEAGDLEMSSDPMDHQEYLSTAFAWAGGDLRRHLPGASDGRAFLDRFDAAMSQVASLGLESVALFSHGAALRTWTAARVHGVDVEEMERVPLANTGSFDVEGDPDSGWRLVSWSADPLGGKRLAAVAAEDPTGESMD